MSPRSLLRGVTFFLVVVIVAATVPANPTGTARAAVPADVELHRLPELVQAGAAPRSDLGLAALQPAQPEGAGLEDVPPPLLVMAADPFQVLPGEVITYSVAITNVADAPLTSVVLSDALPAGVVYVAQSGVGFTYSPSDKQFTWAIDRLEPGQGLHGGFQLRATGLAIGALVINTVSASSTALAQPMAASAVVEVAPPRRNRIWVTPGEGGWLRSEDGQVELRIPAGAVDRTVRVSYVAQPNPGDLPHDIFALFNLDAAVASGQPVHQFTRPLRLRWTLPRILPPGMGRHALSFFYRDESNGQWVRIESGLDRPGRWLEAELSHFSAFGVGRAEQVETTTPTWLESDLRGIQPALFSGSITYDYPFALPPGRGGLTPPLGLSYNSSQHNGTQGERSRVGKGWSLTGADYVARASRTAEITLFLQGHTYTIARNETFISEATKFYVKEDPMIRVEYLESNNPFFAVANWAEWMVTTQDGTRFRFRGEAHRDGNQIIEDLPMVFDWGCNPFGANNEWRELIWLQVPLIEIIDTTGNSVTYHYDYQHEWKSDNDGCYPHFTRNRVSTIMLDNLRYNGGQSQVDLTYNETSPFGLTQVEVQALVNGQVSILHSYELNAPQPNYWLLSVDEKVDTNSRQTAFEYEPESPDRTKYDKGDYGYLKSIRNSYGGRAEFAAIKRNDMDGREWGLADLPPHITSRKLYDGIEETAQEWTYSGVDWVGAWDDTTRLAKGFSQMNVLWPDLGTGERRLERHYFHVRTNFSGTLIDHLAGRESKVETCLPQAPVSAQSACASELRRVETEWNHTVSQLPFPPSAIQTSLPIAQKARFVYPANVTQYEATRAVLRTTYDYLDAARQGDVGLIFGNHTMQQDFLASNGALPTSPLRTNYTWYYPNQVQWITQTPARMELYQVCVGCSGGAIVTQRLLYYDQNTASDHELPPTQGLLRFDRQGSGTAWLLTMEYQYWSNGNLRRVIDERGRVTETFYDSLFQAYVVCTRNALNHTAIVRYYGVPGSADQTPGQPHTCDNTPAGSGLVTPGAFFGQVEQERDPNYSASNDTAVNYQYDVWGRLAKVIRPGDDAISPTTQFFYREYDDSVTPVQPYRVTQQQRDNAPGVTASYLNAWTLYDGLGRPVQSQTEAADPAQVIVASTAYNGQGQVVKQNVPYFSPTGSLAAGEYRAPDWGREQTVDTVYDALGRVVQVTNTDSSTVRSFYRYQAGDVYPKTAVLDSLNHQTISESDGLGRLVSVRQYAGAYASANFAASVFAQSQYQYDVAGRLTRMTGPDGAVTTITYDALGRKTGMTDPDMGAWSYGYDAASNLVRQTDARNRRVCFYYDDLNRLKGKTFSTGAGVCPNDPGYSGYAVKFYHDTDENGAAVDNGKGRRTGMADESSSTTWEYDARGRVMQETMSITPPGFTSALNYETDYSYDAADRVRTMTYPAINGARETVTTTYNAQGLPYSLTSSTGATYVSSTTYDALGRLYQQMLGNQLMTEHRYWGWSDSEGAGRLRRILVLKAPYNAGDPANRLQDLHYRYDAAGNVTHIQDMMNRGADPNNGPFQHECFSYDALNRLARGYTTFAAKFSQTPYYNPCSNAPSTGGSGPYDQSYAYTPNGNLDSKTGIGVYTYNAPSPSGCAAGTPATKPHAVSAAGGNTYSYDCNGNMIGRTVGASTVALTYDAENRLAEVDDPGRPVHLRPTAFTYNADGQRVVMSNPNSGMAFVGNHMEAFWSLTALATTLDSFEATPQGDAILVSWVTTAETDVMGFNLHRNTVPDQPAQQLNSAMITAQHPGSTSGAAYQWLDEDLPPDQTTYYWLEVLTLSGESEWHGPISVDDGQPLAGRAPNVVTPSNFKRYYYLGGQRIAMRVIYTMGNDLYYLHSDHLGSNRLGTGESGQVLLAGPSAHYPYGELRYGIPSGNYRFTGQHFDYETGLYYYGARYYDSSLGRFISPDTIVPEPGNPQALNRYSYVLNNPLRYTDPTGHFTDDAIRAYLQSMYGDEWHSYWDAWSADQAWMDLLHAAEGGDIMTRASLDDGFLSLEHFLLAGTGQDLLSGVYNVSQLTSSPSVNTSVALHDLYLNPSEGMAVFRFSNATSVQTVHTTGRIGIEQNSVTRGDVRMRNVADWLTITVIGRGISSLLGLILGGGKALTSPEWGELPGRKVGDIEIWIGLSTDLGDYTRVSVYETIFRDGVNLGRQGLFDGVDTWDVPDRLYRRF